MQRILTKRKEKKSMYSEEIMNAYEEYCDEQSSYERNYDDED